jgi:hypothetical protein
MHFNVFDDRSRAYCSFIHRSSSHTFLCDGWCGFSLPSPQSQVLHIWLCKSSNHQVLSQKAHTYTIANPNHHNGSKGPCLQKCDWVSEEIDMFSWGWRGSSWMKTFWTKTSVRIQFIQKPIPLCLSHIQHIYRWCTFWMMEQYEVLSASSWMKILLIEHG